MARSRAAVAHSTSRTGRCRSRGRRNRTLELQPIVSHRFGPAANASAFETTRIGLGQEVLVRTRL